MGSSPTPRVAPFSFGNKVLSWLVLLCTCLAPLDSYPYLVVLCVERFSKVLVCTSAHISRTLSVHTNTVSVACLVQAGPVGANVCVHV